MAAFPNTTPAPEILRPIIESERLIAILDAIDPDPDLEDLDDSEPWLGWSLGGYSFGRGDDRELDTVDDEPILGAIEVKLPVPLYRMGGGHGHCLFPALYREHGELTRSEAGFSQAHWNSGPHDLEDEHDGCEPGDDDEWSLGWTDLEARFGKYGAAGDYEEQCDDEGVANDNGIADFGGLGDAYGGVA